MTNDPLVTIIILNWNQADMTLECLRSLEGLTYQNYRIVLVDNGSIDQSVQIIRAEFPHVTIIENEENLGYSEGNNIGIRYALKLDPQYIFLLNNDTVVDPDMLKKLVCAIELDTAIAATGPKMYYFDHPNIIWSAGAHVDIKTGDVIRLRAEEKDNNPSIDVENKKVNLIGSCGLLLRRKAIDDLGVLDSRFFIYYDETDWCIRAINLGWEIVYVPQAMLWHKVSLAMGVSSPTTDYYMTRNRLLFLFKNLSGLQKTLSLMFAVFRELRNIIAYTVKNHKKKRIANRNAKLLGLRDALLNRWGKMGIDVEVICRSQAISNKR